MSGVVRFRVALVVCAASFAHVGCADRDTASRQTVTRTAENSDRWHVNAEPTLILGGDSSLAWGEVVGLALLSDGRLVVASDYPPALSIFAKDGRLLRTVGRRGRGPGEFEAIGTFHHYGDTIFAADLDDVGQHFTLDGRYIRSSERPAGGGTLHGLLANGDRIVGTLKLDQILKHEWRQAPEVIERVGERGRVVLGTFPSQRLSRSADGELAGEIFAPHNRVVVFSDGFCAGYAGDAAIACFDDSGERTGLISIPREPQPVTDDDREAYFADVYLANPSVPKSFLDDEVARLRATGKFAKELGVFGRLLASSDGLLWVGPPSTDAWRSANRNAAVESSSDWLVYSRNGDRVARVTLPAAFVPLAVSHERVAGVGRSDLGVPTVVVFQLLRSSAP